MTDRQTKLICLLGAMCLFLASVEYMIPKPLPFMRLGISNLPLILALGLLQLPAFLLLVFIKIGGQALLSGTLFSYVFVFSLVSTLLSSLSMWVLYKMAFKFISFIGLALVGALVSNLSQLALARYWIFGEAITMITPLFLLMGLASGLSLGIFCNIFIEQSLWARTAISENI